MIRIHLHAFDRRWIRVNQIPGFAAIRAAPQSRCVRVHGLGIERIEDKEIHDAAQVEHAPRAPAIMSDVGTSHVAGDKDSVGIMRADGGIKHGPAASRSEDAKVPRPLCPCAGQAENNSDGNGDSEVHGFSGQR